MTRRAYRLALLFGIAFAALTTPWMQAAPASIQEPNTTTRTVAAISGRVDRIDRSMRSLTVRTSEGVQQTIYVGPELKLYNELKTGDTVTVRVVESVVVATQPNARPTAVIDSTAAAKKDSQTSDVMQQLKAVVTVESLDAATQTIIFKTGDNRRVIRPVADGHLLEGLKAGDVIEVTYTRERAIELQREP